MIPARMGSEGFKFKNRKFFKLTADFLQNVPWLNRVIVSTDDPVIKDYARKLKFEVHDRHESLAGSTVSIHQVFENVIGEMNVNSDDVLWLFYLPVLYKNINDFEKAKEIIEKKEAKSLCTFVSAKSHPFNCWKFDFEKKELLQYVQNDCFRRQDLPAAWIHYHYVYCFRAKVLKTLNSEMINAETHPIFLEDKVSEKLIEIDTPEDYDRWKASGCLTG